MKLLVFDGNSIINRAFYAIKNLTTRDGMPTNALHGFMKLYFKYFEMSQPDMVAVAFDVKAPTFRHKMYDEYKAQRKGMPDDLAIQLAPLKEILEAMNVAIFEKEGYEADDIIGTLAGYCTQKGYECDIVSGDRDDFQLIGDNVRVIMPVTRGGMSEVEVYDKKAILEKYGFEPKSIIDLKAIMGDSSDNIKGVAGIGEKGAMELISAYGTLEAVYDNLDKIKPALSKKLEADKESAFLSKTLATIISDVPVEIDDSDLLVKKYDEAKLFSVLERFELTSIIKQTGVKCQTCEDVTIQSAAAEQYTDYFVKNGLFFLIYNNIMYAKGDGVCLKISDYTPLLLDDNISKFTYKPKEVYKKLLETSKDILPFYDIEVAQYVIDPSANNYDLAGIIFSYLKLTADTDSEDGIASCVCVLDKIVDIQKQQIENNSQQKLLYEIEFPLTLVLADMENIGFGVDKTALERFSKKLESDIAALEERIYFLAGERFNINSPKQLGVILFEKLALSHGKKTKTGYSTNADVLAKLSGKHEIIDEILEYRQIAKLKSTYCDGLIGLIDGNGRIHSSFNQTVTQTGRISSTEPNLQNIPVRTELGSRMREMFVAKDGFLLVDADYSQIELRVLSHIANDKAMLLAFENDADIHTVTAASVFAVPEAFVTPEMRRAAKAVNFGIVYGISDFSLAQDIKTTKAQAKKYIDSYLELYSGVREYMTDIVDSARKDGFVSTLAGRRRYLPELSSSNYLVRSFGERAALNAPIQGTAADIIKIAMVNTRRALIEGGFEARLVLQVHDELIIEAPENEKEAVSELLSRQMENAMSLNVRLKADVNCGRTWYECK